MPSCKILATPIAHNEEVKIKSVLERLKAVDFISTLLIDDASTDQTRRVAEEAEVKVITHDKRAGVGVGIRTAIRYAQEQGFDILVILAGNDKDRPSEISRLVNPIVNEKYDLVQGSRYLPGGVFGNMPLYRQFFTRFVHPFLFSLITGRKITDSTNGFRAIRLSALNDPRINLNQSWLEQYELEPYLYYKFIKLGYSVKEVPVTKIYPPKTLGYTKMTPVIGWWSILRPIFLLGLGIKK